MEHQTAAPQPVTATPTPDPAGIPAADDVVLSLQRTAGNQAVGRAIARGVLRRDVAPETAAAVAITGVTVTPGKSTMPLEGALRARAAPAHASSVKYSLEADSVASAARTSIDAATGAING